MSSRSKTLLVPLAIYFPILIVVTPLNDLLPLNKVWYGVAVLGLFLSFALLLRGSNLLRIEGATAFMFISGYWLAALLAMGAAAGEFRTGYLEGIGLIVGILVMLTIVTMDREGGTEQEIAAVIEKAGYFLGLLLIVQTAFSLQESISGEPYLHNEAGHFDFYTYFDQRARSFLLNIEGLNFALSGLILQHNNFGVQLAFLNLLFALLYYGSRRRVFLLFMGVAVVAVALNTTRVAMIGVLITDVILWSAVRGVVARASLYLTLPLAVFLLLSSALIGFGESIETGTVAYRLSRWLTLYSTASENMDVLNLLFGGTAFSLTGTFQVGRSMENQFIYMMLFFGIAGLSAFVYLLLWLPLRLTAEASPEVRRLALAFVLNVGVLSMAMDNLLFAAIFPIIGLGFLYLAILGRRDQSPDAEP